MCVLPFIYLIDWLLILCGVFVSVCVFMHTGTYVHTDYSIGHWLPVIFCQKLPTNQTRVPGQCCMPIVQATPGLRSKGIG